MGSGPGFGCESGFPNRWVQEFAIPKSKRNTDIFSSTNLFVSLVAGGQGSKKTPKSSCLMVFFKSQLPEPLACQLRECQFGRSSINHRTHFQMIWEKLLNSVISDENAMGYGGNVYMEKETTLPGGKWGSDSLRTPQVVANARTHTRNPGKER